MTKSTSSQNHRKQRGHCGLHAGHGHGACFAGFFWLSSPRPSSRREAWPCDVCRTSNSSSALCSTRHEEMPPRVLASPGARSRRFQGQRRQVAEPSATRSGIELLSLDCSPGENHGSRAHAFHECPALKLCVCGFVSCRQKFEMVPSGDLPVKRKGFCELRSSLCFEIESGRYTRDLTLDLVL